MFFSPTEWTKVTRDTRASSSFLQLDSTDIDVSEVVCMLLTFRRVDEYAACVRVSVVQTEREESGKNLHPFYS